MIILHFFGVIDIYIVGVGFLEIKVSAFVLLD